MLKRLGPHARINSFHEKLRMRCASVIGVHLMLLSVHQALVIEFWPFTRRQPRCPIKAMVLSRMSTKPM